MEGRIEASQQVLLENKGSARKVREGKSQPDSIFAKASAHLSGDGNPVKAGGVQLREHRECQSLLSSVIPVVYHDL